jgi:hypothetical protein
MNGQAPIRARHGAGHANAADGRGRRPDAAQAAQYALRLRRMWTTVSAMMRRSNHTDQFSM